jgi:DNA-binding transcriptional regulator YiaG
MKKSDFEGLRGSVREMLAIEREQEAPARTHVYQGKVLIRIEENGEVVWSLATAGKTILQVIAAANPRSIGEFIQVLRETLNQSQEGFAEMLSIPLATLQGWEQGRRTPDAAAEKLLRVTAKRPDVVFDDDPQHSLELSF